MALQVIRLGDPTSHGGKVISASTTHTIDGVGVARVGDMVACPLPGHGINPIISGATTYLIGGRMAALQGNKSACGCSLISTLTTVSYG